MKWLLLLAVLMAGPARAEEEAAPSVREKLRAKIVESLPPRPPEVKAEPAPEQESAVLVLEPIVVSESRAVRELEKLLISEKERKEAERFSAAKGGAIYSSKRLDVGSWWTPKSGWQFLKIKW